MAIKLRIASVKPHKIDTSSSFHNTVWESSAVESVAHAIVVIAKVRNRGWAKFSWEQYKEHCTHRPADSERVILDELVHDEYLSWDGDSYHVTNRFIRALSNWIK